MTGLQLRAWLLVCAYGAARCCHQVLQGLLHKSGLLAHGSVIVVALLLRSCGGFMSPWRCLALVADVRCLCEWVLPARKASGGAGACHASVQPLVVAYQT